MAQATADPRARRLKELSSEVKKLRGWAASDSSVADRLCDALNELTAQRLLAHQWGAAMEDAQDALTRANRLVSEHGAVGPFTPTDDGVRFFTATTHLATAQAGAGHPVPAGQMAQALRGWTALLPHVDLTPSLGARTATWLLQTQARALLAAGDPGAANAYADAALDRAREGRLGSGDDAPALVDALALASDSRWAAGRPSEAVALARAAVADAEPIARPVLDAASSVADVRVARDLTPWVAARTNLADRLLGSGAVAEALAERRGLADTLAARAERLGPVGRDALARVLADLADDLLTVDRDADALDAAGRAAEVAGGLAATESTPGAHLGAQFAAVTALARALLRAGEPAQAAEALAALLDRFASLRRPAGFEAALAETTLVRADVERATGDEEAAERSLRAFHTAVGDLLDDSPAGRSQFGDIPAAIYVRARRRGVVLASPHPVPDWTPLSDADALAAATRGVAVEEVMPVGTTPVPPVEEAAPSGPDVVGPVEESAPLAPEAPVPGSPATPAEPEAPEPASVTPPVPTAAEDHADTAAPSASAPVTAARAELRQAQASGDRRAALAAAQRLVETLRPLAGAEPGRWGGELVAALEDLGEATFRTGDWWGSRAPKKEARQLARQFGL